MRPYPLFTSSPGFKVVDPWDKKTITVPYSPDDSRWVQAGSFRTKQSHPYSFDSYFIHGDRISATKAKANFTYSDRMSQWDDAKLFQAEIVATNGARKQFLYYTPEECIRFVEAYFGSNHEFVGLAEGCNVSSGYPFFIWMTKEKR